MEDEDDPAGTIREIRRSLKRKRNELRSNVRGYDISTWCLQVALCIGLIMNYDFRHSADWLMRKRRKGLPIPLHLSVEEVRESI